MSADQPRRATIAHKFARGTTSATPSRRVDSAGTLDKSEPILRVDGVSKKFGNVWAVENVSLEIAPVEIVGVVGPNGAGKTTLFNLIAGALRLDTGRILLRDVNITRHPPHKHAREGIARTFQLTRPFVSMPLRDNLRTAALACGASHTEAAARTREVLAELGLTALADKQGADLNAVEAKRLEVARALVIQPSILLLDEIFSGSGPDEVDELIRLVKQLRARGLTILVIEHNIRAIRAIADRVIAMNVGRIISEGSPEHVFTDAQVTESYLGPTGKT